MPDRKTHFPEAENTKYNVSNVLNVLSDGSSIRPRLEMDDDASSVEINVEEGAPFTDGIDPQATIGEYMKLHEEEEAYEASIAIHEEPDPLQEAAIEAEEIIEDAPEAEADTAEEPEDVPYIYEAPETTVKSPVIREQAEKARSTFMDDLRSVDAEPAIQRMIAREEQENEENDALEQNVAEEVKEDIASPVRRVRKPRFKKPAPVEPVEEEPKQQEAPESNDLVEDDVLEEPVAPEDTFVPEDDQMPEEEDFYTEENAEEETEDYDFDGAYAQAVAAQRNSICEDLHELQQHLEQARSPFMHKSEVLVPREKTLRLIRSLTAICDVNPSYIDGVSEDMLIDRLACENNAGDYEPLKRARCRAQTIIQNATKQAETIVTDAKVLATQLLAETEAEIKEKFDDADMQIAVRMDTAKEESSKKLNEARSELTTSRQHSVEILSKYLEKAEIDYQGYWERAENTVMASLEQSESILMKAAEIYRKELEVIRQDRDELSEILDHLKRYKRL